MMQIILPVLLFFVFTTLSWQTILAIFVILVLTYLFNLYQQQASILYQRRLPQQPIQKEQFPPFFQTPADYGLQYQELMLKTPDNKEISAYYVPAHKQAEDGTFIPIINKRIAEEMRRHLQIEGIMTGNGFFTADLPTDDVVEFTTPAARNVRGVQNTLLETNVATKEKNDDIITAICGSAILSSTPDSTYNLYEMLHNDKHHVDAEIGTYIMFHGNAGSINHRLPNIFHLVSTLGVNVFMVDYRGYGRSTDVEPSEEGLILDAMTCYQYVHGRMDLNRHLLYIMGSSLGGAVSIALTAAIERAMRLSQQLQADEDAKSGENKNKKKKQQKTRQNIDESDGDDDSTTDGDDDDDDENNAINKPIYQKKREEFIKYDLKDNTKNTALFSSTKNHLALDDGKDHQERDFIQIITPSLVGVAPPCGLILENTFTSVSDFVDKLFPFIAPCKSFMLKLKWYSLQRIGTIHNTPILFINSEKDEVIPAGMMTQLHNTVLSMKKLLNRDTTQIVYHSIPTGSHNNAWILGGTEYIHQMQQFLQMTAKTTTFYAQHIKPLILSGKPLTAQADEDDSDGVVVQTSDDMEANVAREKQYKVLFQNTDKIVEQNIHKLHTILLTLSKNGVQF